VSAQEPKPAYELTGLFADKSLVARIDQSLDGSIVVTLPNGVSKKGIQTKGNSGNCDFMAVPTAAWKDYPKK
jgi:hypothetical protein